MDAKEFVKHWKTGKEDFLKLYTSGSEETEVASLIKEMELSPKQKDLMKLVLDGVLTDIYYSLLLGLDGAGSIGDIQHIFKIYDESGNLVSDCDGLEAEAWG
ncbi:hypothetical protein ACJJIK_02235 [Microbulbifer sp. ZKSA006]|uniref:hypothetical protein n=1 Tax=Microbulbifer sp. ZKSA006 TaxID=3243390 RepID=UPI00403A4AE1